MADVPNPGSKEAIAAGCKCPALDNSHGKGRYRDGDKSGWWITEGCSLHDKRTAEAE